MFGLFTDNKPNIIKAIGIAAAKEAENFELVKKMIVQIVNENQNNTGMYSLFPGGDRLLLSDKSFSLPKQSGTVVEGSSREMFQALNQISKNAHYNSESDYASGDVENFEISMMKIKGSDKININADIKNKKAIIYQLIKDSGGKTL